MSNCPFADQSESLRAICKRCVMDPPQRARLGMPNYTQGRTYNGKTYKIDRITLHCVWGHTTLKNLAAVFQTDRSASSNYGIDDNGNIGMFVPEDSRSWCSSSAANDVRAVTVEISSDADGYTKMTDKAVDAAVKLCVDICIRNGIRRMYWRPNVVPYPRPKKNTNEREQNQEALARENDLLRSDEGLFTVHMWFEDKPCPGPFLVSKMNEICDRVNAGIEAVMDSKLAIKSTPNGAEREITNLEILKNDNRGTKPVRLMYVDGCKYVTFNNFEEYTTLPTLTYDINVSNSFNTLWGYGKKLMNSPVSMTERNVNLFKTTLTLKKSNYKNVDGDATSYLDVMYVFSDCSYDFRIKFKYDDKLFGTCYPSDIEVFAKSKAISEINYDANKYSDWVKIHDGVISTENDSINITIAGYIRNQAAKTPYVTLTFKPQFKVTIGSIVDKWFDFDGYTKKEDLKTNYCGTFPRVDIAAVGEKSCTEESCVQVNTKAISFTPIDKLI